MIEFRNSRFLKSVIDLDNRPEIVLPEILFVGKSNVGKSSLINSLCDNKSLAYVSSKPGHTKMLNYYAIDRTFYLVDAPGYGYSASSKKHVGQFAEIMESYFQDLSLLKGVIFLLDSRHKPSREDLDFYSFLQETNLPFILVMTKIDKLNQKEKHAMKVNLKQLFPNLGNEQIVEVSSLQPSTMVPLKKLISQLLTK